jgi:ribosomal protein L37E
MTWRCPNCGHINQDINTNCAQCGTSSYGGPPPIKARKQPVAKGPPQWALRRAGEWAQREMPTPPQTPRSRLTNLFAGVMGFIRGPAERKRLAILQNQRTEAANMETRIQRGFNEFVGQSATPEDISKYNENQLRERSEEEAREATIQATRRRADWEDEEYRKDKEEVRGEATIQAARGRADWEDEEYRKDKEEMRRERGEEAEYKEKLSKMQGGEEGVDKDHTRCERCWKVYKKSEPSCPNCHFQNREYVLEPGKMFCYYPDCKAIISVHDKVCPKCKRANKGYLALEPLSKTTSKRVSGKLYETLIYELVGVFVLFGLPFFGLPSLPLLGAVIMALLPFYSFLPDERQVLSSRETGDEDLGGWGGGVLVLKSGVKMIAFILSVIQFITVPVSKLIPLGISFAYYFTLPTYYKVTEPSRMLEAWLRVGVGILIAWFMLMSFAGSPQAWSLAIMSVAFFCTSFPKHKEAEEERKVVRVTILNKGALKYLKGALDLPLKIIFSILMLVAWWLSGIGFNGLNATPLQIIFASVWALSFVSGWAAGTEGRPALGLLMIPITLFVLTFTSTGVIGQAVFGYWWPQVYALGESVVEPLAPILEQFQTGMADSWLMLSNPMGYYDQMAKRQQATKTVPKEGGTTKSIEVTRTELFTSVPGQLDPRLDPIVGTIEVQNQGEFDADGIGFKIWATWQDPEALKEVCTGSFYKFECSTQASSEPPPIGPSDSSGCNVKTCWWPETTYSREIKLVSFVFNSGSGERKFGDDASAWAINTDVDPNLNICTPDCDAENATYVHSGQTVKINTNISYSYKVNVSLPVEVIEFDTYRELLQAKEITLQELTSQYTGGPVKATLWSQRQPIRGGETSLFVASIYNDGGGTIDRINNFKIKIPNDLGDVEMVSSTFYVGAIGTEGCRQDNDVGGFTEINCEHYMSGHPLKSGEYKRVSFLVTPLETMSVDRMTRLIIGLANYEYTKTTSKSITVANAPYH